MINTDIPINFPKRCWVFLAYGYNGYVYLSLVIEGPNIPEEVTRYTPLYTGECWLRLREDQWEEDVRKNLENFYAETGQPLDQLEKDVQAQLDKGQKEFDVGFDVLSREENTLIVNKVEKHQREHR